MSTAPVSLRGSDLADLTLGADLCLLSMQRAVERRAGYGDALAEVARYDARTLSRAFAPSVEFMWLVSPSGTHLHRLGVGAYNQVWNPAASALAHMEKQGEPFDCFVIPVDGSARAVVRAVEVQELRGKLRSCTYVQAGDTVEKNGVKIAHVDFVKDQLNLSAARDVVLSRADWLAVQDLGEREYMKTFGALDLPKRVFMNGTDAMLVYPALEMGALQVGRFAEVASVSSAGETLCGRWTSVLARVHALGAQSWGLSDCIAGCVDLDQSVDLLNLQLERALMTPTVHAASRQIARIAAGREVGVMPGLREIAKMAYGDAGAGVAAALQNLRAQVRAMSPHELGVQADYEAHAIKTQLLRVVDALSPQAAADVLDGPTWRRLMERAGPPARDVASSIMMRALGAGVLVDEVQDEEMCSRPRMMA